MDTLNNLKRKSIIADFNISLKKYKFADDNDNVDIDEDLTIDLDFNLTEDTHVKQTATRPLDCDSVSVTLSTGRRCYVKLRNDDHIESNIKAETRVQTASPEYYRLLDEIESNSTRKKLLNYEDKDVVVCSTDGLWVDKYSPKKYGELLSNESVNRNLLTWMKLWDKYVFKKDTGITISKTDTFGEDPFLVNEHDGRPMKKAVLLSGPPGAGKTTLAQILARHCGYRIHEINASNDRNPEQFYEKIDTVNSMSSWTNQQNEMKPSCLIIDEIDGTSLAAINVLISAINSSMKSSEATKRKGKDKGKLSIRRPVICICNDLYTSSLKQLRPLCYVIRVGAPDYSQMLFRITDICDTEGMSCDRNVFDHLIDNSNRDIRSCLNTLQFLKQKGSKTVTMKDLEGVNIGNKDVQNGIFSVWEEIFTSTTLKRPFTDTNGKRLNESSQRCQNILRLTQSAGDLDRVISGIHENYLSLVRFKDVHLKQMAESTKWFVFNDLVNQKVADHQMYELMKYKQYLVPYFHLSFASSSLVNKKIQWPTSDINAHFGHQKMAAIYDSFMSSQTVINTWFHAKQEIVKVVLPCLSQIIRPCQLRPINTQLYSSKEKIILHNTVINMISTGLTYVQEKTGELNFQYVLQPNIDTIVEFNISTANRKYLPYSTKQLIANEVRAEKIRKHESTAAPLTVHNTQNRMAIILEKEKAMTKSNKIIETKKKPAQFRFQIEKKSNETDCGEVNIITKLLNQTVLFRFKEGCTNAIRRAVKVKDL